MLTMFNCIVFLPTLLLFRSTSLSRLLAHKNVKSCSVQTITHTHTATETNATANWLSCRVGECSQQEQQQWAHVH